MVVSLFGLRCGLQLTVRSGQALPSMRASPNSRRATAKLVARSTFRIWTQSTSCPVACTALRAAACARSWMASRSSALSSMSWMCSSAGRLRTTSRGSAVVDLSKSWSCAARWTVGPSSATISRSVRSDAPMPRSIMRRLR